MKTTLFYLLHLSVFTDLSGKKLNILNLVHRGVHENRFDDNKIEDNKINEMSKVKI